MGPNWPLNVYGNKVGYRHSSYRTILMGRPEADKTHYGRVERPFFTLIEGFLAPGEGHLRFPLHDEKFDRKNSRTKIFHGVGVFAKCMV